jgi:hypothetical protein
MNITSSDTDKLTEELLAILDAETQNLEATLGYLSNLRVNVIRRDESALTCLLESITIEQEGREAAETRRQKFRQLAAEVLGCRVDQVTLTRFMERLSEEMRSKVAQRKAVLERLVTKLKTEYAATTMLLNECSRFNRILIDSIIGSRCKGTTMYNANGQTQRQGGSGFVTMQF